MKEETKNEGKSKTFLTERESHMVIQINETLHLQCIEREKKCVKD